MGNWNKHTLIDTVSVSLGSLFFKKYFHGGIESVGIDEHLEAVHIDVPQLLSEQECQILSETLAGQLDSAINLAQWKGSEYPREHILKLV